jgi:hypothetical protein
MRKEDRRDRVISPSSSPLPKEPDLGVTTPRPFAVRRETIQACSPSLRARAFLLKSCLTSHLTASSGGLASLGSL